MPSLFLCVVPQGEFPCMAAFCLHSSRCSRARGIPVWSSVRMCLWDSYSHSEDCWDLPIKGRIPFTSENTHVHRQGDGLWYYCSVMVLLAVLPDYGERVLADRLSLCLCSHLSFHWKQRKKKKNPPWMNVWPHLPMSACLLAHHFLWCMLKMGPKTFVGIILVLSCTPTSIHPWSKPQRVKILWMEQKTIPLKN